MLHRSPPLPLFPPPPHFHPGIPSSNCRSWDGRVRGLSPAAKAGVAQAKSGPRCRGINHLPPAQPGSSLQGTRMGIGGSTRPTFHALQLGGLRRVCSLLSPRGPQRDCGLVVRSSNCFHDCGNWPPSLLCLTSRPLPLSPWITLQINYLLLNSCVSISFPRAQPLVCPILMSSIIAGIGPPSPMA